MSEDLESRINNRFNRLEMILGLALETQAQLGQLIVERRAIYDLKKKKKIAPPKEEKKQDE